MSLAMTKDERESFLAGLHVGVISIPDPGRGPLTTPIWYDYQPGGELWVITDRDSRKGRLLSVGTRISLVAQTETIPYQYVSVEGPVVAVDPHPARGTVTGRVAPVVDLEGLDVVAVLVPGVRGQLRPLVGGGAGAPAAGAGEGADSVAGLAGPVEAG